MSDAVLFPGVVLPLHIFEPCYRDMVSDALASHKSWVVVKTGAPPSGGQAAPMCDVGCIAKIIHAEPLPEGRFNVLLQGIDRFRLVQEVAGAWRYRCVSGEIIERPDAPEVQAARAELMRLHSCVYTLANAAAQCDQQLVEVLHSTDDPVALADILAAVLVKNPAEQQVLLATTDLRARLRQLLDKLAEVLLRYDRPASSSRRN
jgi:Lon protease-like protein